MRFVVYGAGAIGGVVAARLHQHGHDVTAIARGPHLEAITTGGLRLQDPTGEQKVPLPAVPHPSALDWHGDEVVLLAVKSQQTAQVLRDLGAVAPNDVPVVCLQNGIDNERQALRRFPNVYGVMVGLPAVHLEPGLVQAYSSPVTGILDIGRRPDGTDETAHATAAAFTSAGFDSRVFADIGRWKWRKLITNLGNAIGAVCGSAARGSGLYRRAAAEADACLAAAGTDVATIEEDEGRRAGVLTMGDVAGASHPGSSSWQSLARHSAEIETDYLNGEIVLLGRLQGVPTPVNAVLQRLANALAANGGEPGSVDVTEVERLIEEESDARAPIATTATGSA
ncbi:2-dehydropantoate 2-reductase N-terminal domain-containing protein [Georgenia halophila]|uniref:2-dehydropantoate 2-reductase n=1 Tax=Georgenia halophila TaxID=620889 RepID=A0ABP8LAR2_9MICO